MGDRPSSFTRSRSAAVARQQPQEQLFDTHPEVSLDFEIVRQAARQKYTRPFLILDTAIVRAKARRFRAAMPRVRPHYAVKANPDRRVLKVLAQEGCGFEIASTAELDLLLGLGVPGRGGLLLQPREVARGDRLRRGQGRGVVRGRQHRRGAQGPRGRSPTPGSTCASRPPTSAATGRSPASSAQASADAREIVALAAKLGADLAGVTFHVGSQCRNPENWRVALEKARSLFDAMAKAGLKPRLLNIGGGYPVRHVKPIPSIEMIGQVVNEGLKAFPEEVQVIAEPGRYLVSDAGYFVCRVLGTANRAGKRWMHWDAGMFGGVIETTEGLKYRIRTDRSGPDIPWTVGGPTCDSVDIVMRDEPLPSDLQEGDFIYICNAGAYTTAYASQFNGFPLPEVRVFESKA